MRDCFEAGISDDSVRLDAEAFGTALSETYESLYAFLVDLDEEYERD